MRWTSSHSSVDALAPQICSRTSGWKISAPPPGRLPRPGVHQLTEDLLGREPGDLGEEDDLDRRVRLNVNLWRGLLDPLDHVDVVLKRQLVVQPADDVQLRRAPVPGLASPVDDLVAIHHIGLCLAEVGPEGAEVTGVHAHVRRIDVRVHVVITEVSVVPLAHQVGHLAQREQVVGGLERQTVLEAQSPASLNLFPDRLQPYRFGRHAFILPDSITRARFRRF